MNNRRDVSSRNTKFAKRAAFWIANRNISPNTISVFSIVFSLFTLISFYLDSVSYLNHQVAMILAIVGIQGRLIMNLLDGMVAIEFNKKSLVGGLYNEVPDRISDTLIIFGSGLLVAKYQFGMDLAYLAIILSAFTAYIRTLGASLNCPHFFSGPMAKQHRMALISISCVIGIWYIPIFYIVLILMNVGLLITCARRLNKISVYLKSMDKCD
jgi:phosphatidylglycerophosphate synthase